MRLTGPTGSALPGEHLVHRCVDLFPIALLFGQLRAAGARNGIEPGAPPVFQLPPLPRNPALLFETMQRREERSGTDQENAARYLLDPVGHADTMQGPQ